MTRIAIFASGSGSNAENIATYFSTNKNVEVVLILTNNPTAFVLERAKKLGIKSLTFNKHDFLKTGEILNFLRKNDINLIVLAGFLLKIPKNLLNAFPNKIINIHPALLPKYGGKGMFGNQVHQSVIEAKEKESGITIHYVNENYDEGKIIFQARCSINPTDTANDLAYKIHALEYAHFPKVIEQLITSSNN
ncbi:MAG: phosphoribosylglycinamide formyltransferase [Flavobacteriales bacterium CG_4_10_14_0_2_um_filter_32_8]|nr:MAG: phosphoribosylglycinamide formyltransferase [Flavobacteriales bacterium CG_4_10_14_0_2_um_filter_32_8]PJB15298.1 MAG: phosphoribosylglycinamide formyltransferase [Flavobacteriales bacterium CG_4_9_14_3_um_filter_32_8]